MADDATPRVESDLEQDVGTVASHSNEVNREDPCGTTNNGDIHR
jgi:hypothetical protein